MITSGKEEYLKARAGSSSHNPNILFSSLSDSGIYNSTDRGSSWAPANSGIDTVGILSLAIDPKNENILYATTDQSGVYQTTNGGMSWGAMDDGYPRELSQKPGTSAGLASGNVIAVSPFNSGTLLVGMAGQGIYRWSGSRWTASVISTGAIYNFCFDLKKDGRVLAGVESRAGGMLISPDTGKNWAPSNAGPGNLSVYSVAYNPGNPLNFIAGTSSGVYQSTDGGIRWEPAGLDGQAVKAVSAITVNGHSIFTAGTRDSGYYSVGTPSVWYPIDKMLNFTGIQGIIHDSGNSNFYFNTRLGGLIRVEVNHLNLQ